jgi:nucleoside-diphosphate-sugar epimerase
MNAAIFGSGILSLDAASNLRKKKYHVTLAARQPEALHDFMRAAEKSIILNDYDEESLIPIIANNPVIIVASLSEISKETAQTSLEVAEAIRRCAAGSDFIRRIIYVSSTTVYGDHKGLWVDETSTLKGKSEEAKLLLKAERLIKSLEDLSWSVCILRIAELYGPGREISKRMKLVKGPLPGSGTTYTNMIHRSDVASAIEYCISHHLDGIYNLADDDHPTREELYDQVTKKFHLPKTTWDPNYDGWKSINKRISNRKIKSAGFSLRHPSRVID